MGMGGISSTVQDPGLAENSPDQVPATHVSVPDQTHGNTSKVRSTTLGDRPSRLLVVDY